jgi:thymidylate synthase
MNQLDIDYQNLLKDILENGVSKNDRTGTGTLSVFGRQIKYSFKNGKFPLLTTKKMAWKTLVTELLWFLRGDTNIKYLVDNGCHIWDGDAYKNYTNEGGELTQEEFINKIKTDERWEKSWGDLGPIYGKQWRSWDYEDYSYTNDDVYPKTKTIDQIANLISELETNPDSRRLMVSAWNVGQLEEMLLPPCHYGFQVYTRELNEDERYELCAAQKSKMTAISEEDYIKYNIPKRAISLMWNQRSCDLFLGIPFNIASYGLLLEIIAKEVNMVPEDLIGNLGDVHLYNNHLEQAAEQCSRTPYELPKLNILHNPCKDVEIEGHKTDISHYNIMDFQIENYQSHPSIKAPLSN